jgi:uncharacterized membrane protein (DUF106 family)
MLETVFQALDPAIGFLPATVRVLLWGTVTGAITMGIYGLISPQEKIGEAAKRSNDARREMRQYDGTDMSVVWELSRKSLKLSLRQFGLVLLPTLIAAIPVLVVITGLETVYLDTLMIPFGPEWFQSWYTVLLIGLSIGAVVVKVVFKIH